MPRTGHCARHCRMIRTLKSSMTAATVADRRDGISQSAEYGRTLISAYDETGLPSFVQRRQPPGGVLIDGRHRVSIARSVAIASVAGIVSAGGGSSSIKTGEGSFSAKRHPPSLSDFSLRIPAQVMPPYRP